MIASQKIISPTRNQPLRRLSWFSKYHPILEMAMGTRYITELIAVDAHRQSRRNAAHWQEAPDELRLPVQCRQYHA